MQPPNHFKHIVLFYFLIFIEPKILPNQLLLINLSMKDFITAEGL